MLRLILLVVLLFSVTCISGCGKPEDPFIGVWQVNEAGTRENIAEALRKESDSKGTKASEDDVKRGVELYWVFIKEGDIRFEIRADKTYQRTSKGKLQEHGTWSLNESIMTFTIAPDSPLKRAKPYTATASNGRLQVAFNADKGEVIAFDPVR